MLTTTSYNLQKPELTDTVGVSIPALSADMDVIAAQLALKAGLTGSTITGLLNSAYCVKADGNGNTLFPTNNAMIILLAVDSVYKSNYLFAIGFKTAGLQPVLSVISSHVMTIGNYNSSGVVTINETGSGSVATNIVTYGISIPR